VVAHTFDIRFHRYGGLAGLFEAPSNTFRWKGAGLLRVDADSISIVPRRGLLSLFPGSRRVPARDLTEVLREGDALRVEFSTGKSTRAVVPFWVRDSNTAEQIVSLLPTRQTVEMEHDAAGVSGRGFRIDWRALAWVAVAVAVAVSAIWFWNRTENPATPVTPAAAAQPESLGEGRSIEDVNAQAVVPSSSKPQPVPAAESPTYPASVGPIDRNEHPRAQYEATDPYAERPADLFAIRVPDANTGTAERPGAGASLGRYTIYVQPIDGIVPIVPGFPVYPAAREEVARFRSEISSLMGTPGSEQQWWQITVRVTNSQALNHPDLYALQDLELAISRAWRNYLFARTYDPRAAEAVREFAVGLTGRLDLYVR